MDRQYLWSRLEHIASTVQGPWLVAGDFNLVLYPEDQFWGKRITQSLLRDFNACIDRCCLLDMKSIGSRFSWCNQQQGAKRILARLDRSLINSDWMQSFPASVVEYINPSISDHSPMLIQTEEEFARQKSRQQWISLGDSNLLEIFICFPRC